VGLSRIPISSGENGKRGITNLRSGTNNKMMMGNPTAAGMTHKQQTKMNQSSSPIRRQREEGGGGGIPIVCVIAKVEPKAISCTATKRRMRVLRTRRSGSLRGVIARSVRK
jgi:hypothetical protein